MTRILFMILRHYLIYKMSTALEQLWYISIYLMYSSLPCDWDISSIVLTSIFSFCTNTMSQKTNLLTRTKIPRLLYSIFSIQPIFIINFQAEFCIRKFSIQYCHPCQFLQCTLQSTTRRYHWIFLQSKNSNSFLFILLFNEHGATMQVYGAPNHRSIFGI